MGYQFDWSVVLRNGDRFLAGLALGVGMAVAALAAGCVLGLLVAYARLSPRRWLSWPAAAYVEAFRNTPLLLLVVFVYFGLPELGVDALEGVESFVATLSLYAGAYMAEVFRAALGSMPKGYADAARAIGMRPWQRQRYVVLPVALRAALPAVANNLISLFKDTSIAAAIAVPELTFVARQVNANTFRVMEAWGAATLLYVATCYALALLLRLAERRLTVGGPAR